MRPVIPVDRFATAESTGRVKRNIASGGGWTDERGPRSCTEVSSRADARVTSREGLRAELSAHARFFVLDHHGRNISSSAISLVVRSSTASTCTDITRCRIHPRFACHAEAVYLGNSLSALPPRAISPMATCGSQKEDVSLKKGNEEREQGFERQTEYASSMSVPTRP